jgi:hypothetical protein
VGLNWSKEKAPPVVVAGGSLTPAQG